MLKKNKRAIFLSLIISFFTGACLIVHSLYPYIGINLLWNTFSFFPSKVNRVHIFYGENIDMSQVLPTSQYYIVNTKGQDLIDIAANLGINLIRITNGHRSFNNNAEAAIYTEDQWKHVLSKMESKGIKALIVIETNGNNSNYYSPEIRPAYLRLVQEYIDSGVFSNPDVYAVDIRNEPILTNANLKMLQTAHTMIKEKYPQLKQTVGFWATTKTPKASYNPNNYIWSNYSAGRKLDNIVDFYSLHMYGLATNNFGMNIVDPNLKTKVFLSEVENGLRTQKPILIEEFGEANGDALSDQDTIGDPHLQAKVYQGVYQALKEMHGNQVIGSVAFDFYSRTQFPDAWAIVKNNGNYLFPAAYILQEYALGKNNPSLQSATVVTSQSYLVQNSDNYTTKKLHMFDRIGLKLHLDSNESYSVSLSANNIIKPAELFHYNQDTDSYNAVFQAISKGSVQINIISNSTFLADTVWTSPAYTLTVSIL